MFYMPVIAILLGLGVLMMAVSLFIVRYRRPAIVKVGLIRVRRP